MVNWKDKKEEIDLARGKRSAEEKSFQKAAPVCRSLKSAPKVSNAPIIEVKIAKMLKKSQTLRIYLHLGIFFYFLKL